MAVNHSSAILGAIIAGLRTRREWTQSELAARSGTSQAVLSRVESGHLQPTVQLYREIAQAFGLSLSKLEARVTLAEASFRRVEQVLLCEGFEMTPVLVYAVVRALPMRGRR